MKKRDIIVVIAVIGLIFAYLAYGKSRSNTVTPEPVATSTSISEITPFDFEGMVVDTSDWQTYRNEKYGYEFKYPKDWIEIDINYNGLETKQISATEKIFQDSKNVLISTNYKQRNLGVQLGLYTSENSRKNSVYIKDLETELKTNLKQNEKISKFKNGDNLIIIKTTYPIYGSEEYRKNIADINIWIATKNNEVYRVIHTGEGGEFYMSMLVYMTGIYRTFKIIN